MHRTVKAPDTKRGRQQAETELAKLVAEVEAGRAASSGMTVAQVCERHVRDRSPGWSPGQAAAERARIARHIAPHIGDVPVERLRPVDVTTWHSTLRAKRAERRNVGEPLSESTIARVHSDLQAALAWAEDGVAIAVAGLRERRKATSSSAPHSAR